MPFIEWLRDAYPDQLISADTWRAEVAKVACAAGADLINDTWGGVDPALPEVAAEFGAGLVCSHTGNALPRTRPFRVSYGTSTRGVVDDVIAQVTAAAERAVGCGVAPDRVLIDPTHDFGKNTFHGLLLLRHVGDLVNTGWPVLMALSNKDFVGETLGVELTERLEERWRPPRWRRPPAPGCFGCTRSRPPAGCWKWWPRSRAPARPRAR